MPRRYSCQNFEANEECEDARCFHCDDESQYLFDSVAQSFAFAFMTPTPVQMAFLALMDIGYDEDDPLDELE